MQTLCGDVDVRQGNSITDTRDAGDPLAKEIFESYAESEKDCARARSGLTPLRGGRSGARATRERH